MADTILKACAENPGLASWYGVNPMYISGRPMTTRDMYSPEFRAELKARMLAGETIVKIAAETGIPRGTLSYWRSRSG